MPFVTSTGEVRESQTPLTPGWLWGLILGIWNFFYLLFYTLVSPGYTKRDERDRRNGSSRGGTVGRGGGGNPWGGGGGGGGGPRQRPIGRPGGVGGASSPECPPMAGGG